jgi:small subunit ribosomal protein S8
MAITDPIADMLTRIRNANERKKDKVDMPASKMKEAMLKILQEEGFISNYKRISDHKQGILRVYMKYSPKGERVIMGIRRVSKPGQKCYKKAEQIGKVYKGMGISIVSTPQGLMVDKKCRQLKIGGEVLCNIW